MPDPADRDRASQVELERLIEQFRPSPVHRVLRMCFVTVVGLAAGTLVGLAFPLLWSLEHGRSLTAMPVLNGIVVALGAVTGMVWINAKVIAHAYRRATALQRLASRVGRALAGLLLGAGTGAGVGAAASSVLLVIAGASVGAIGGLFIGVLWSDADFWDTFGS